MENQQRVGLKHETSERPAYEAPKVVTYTNEEILEALGPAQAGSSYFRPAGRSSIFGSR